MPLRYLFGPVNADFAGRKLAGPRRAGACLAFDRDGTTDLKVGPGDGWDDVRARLPPGWRPDFVALRLDYAAVPACPWSAPVPLVALAGDWELLWHLYRRRLPGCELVLADGPGAERLGRAGLAHVRAANLAGLPNDFLEGPWPEGPRDLDVLFVGNLSPAVQRPRLPHLAPLPPPPPPP